VRATFHDFGWLRYETNPQLNPATGEPFTFTTCRSIQRSSRAYQWCVDWLASVDRYSALLVGLHRVGLWRSRFETITYPAWRFGDIKLDEIEAYIAQAKPVLDQERAAIGGDTLWTNYRLLCVGHARAVLHLYRCLRACDRARCRPNTTVKRIRGCA
jgi:hypothetical protein